MNEHLTGAVSHASSLPLSISDAFGIDRSDPSDARLFDALISMGSGASGLGALGDLYDNTEMEFLQLAQRIRPAYGFTPPKTDIAQQLVLAAHLINANLGIRVIDTELDGFDTHSDQPTGTRRCCGSSTTRSQAFYAALDPRWRSQVTIMTFSEFGRRPEENGDAGTDHGTAAPLFVIGDHVKGGLHGAQPSLTNLDDNGNLVPTVDFRAMYANVLAHVARRRRHGPCSARATRTSRCSRAAPAAPFTGSESGYWLAGPSGGVHGFGRGTKFGSLAHCRDAIVAGAATPTHMGMWLVSGERRRVLLR